MDRVVTRAQHDKEKPNDPSPTRRPVVARARCGGAGRQSMSEECLENMLRRVRANAKTGTYIDNDVEMYEVLNDLCNDCEMNKIPAHEAKIAWEIGLSAIKTIRRLAITRSRGT